MREVSRDDDFAALNRHSVDQVVGPGAGVEARIDRTITGEAGDAFARCAVYGSEIAAYNYPGILLQCDGED